MKIAYYINDIRRGGAQSVVISLAQEMRKFGHEVALVTWREWRGDQQTMLPIIAAAEQSGIELLNVGGPGGFGWGAFFRLAGLLRRKRFDVLHCHLPLAAVTGAAAGWIARTKAVILHEHNTVRFYPPKLAFLRRVAGWLASCTVCYSPDVAAEIVATYSGSGRRRVETIRNGVDVVGIAARAQRTDVGSVLHSLGLPQEAAVVLSAARLLAWKGHASLVRAFAGAARSRPNAYLLVAGEGPQRQELEALVAQLGMEGRVKLLGERDDVVELISCARILCAVVDYGPGNTGEAVGQSVLEAMAAGTPVAVPSYPSAAAVIQNGVNGFTVPAADDAGLQAVLEQALDEPGLRQTVGAAGQLFVQQNLSWASIAKSYVQLYTALIR